MKLFIIFLFLAKNVFSACTSVQMLEDKIGNNIQAKVSLEDALVLDAKLNDLAKWKENSHLEFDELDKHFSPREVDMIVLMEDLLEEKSRTQKEMGLNVGLLSGNIALGVFTSRLINKLINGGHKLNFLKKINTFINADEKRYKNVNRLRSVLNIAAFITPAYLGYREYKLYKLVKETKKKIEIVEELSSSLPEISNLERMIEFDTRRLNQMKEILHCD